MWEQNQPIALISIHAPTRGATCGEFEVLYPNIISIHAPTRGATAKLEHLTSQKLISIHAPTRGATRFDWKFKGH